MTTKLVVVFKVGCKTNSRVFSFKNCDEALQYIVDNLDGDSNIVEARVQEPHADVVLLRHGGYAFSPRDTDRRIAAADCPSEWKRRTWTLDAAKMPIRVRPQIFA